MQSVCVWEQTGQKGDAPEPRSGHTLSVLNSYAYMFGGCGSKGGECLRRREGRARAATLVS